MGSDHVELKSLKSRRDQAQRELKALQDEANALNKKVRDAQGTISKLDRDINKLTQRNKNIIVSEHAMLRYIERVMGMDMEKLKKQILPDLTQSQIRALGNGSYPVGKSHRVKVRDNTIITILTKDEK